MKPLTMFMGGTGMIPPCEVDRLRNADGLTEVTILPGIKVIPERLFENVKTLQRVYIPSQVEVIEDRAFAGCENLRSVQLPYELNSMGSEAFAGCKSLPWLEIPPKLKVIPRYAFEECTALRTLVGMTEVRTIEPYAFSGCLALRDVEMFARAKEHWFHLEAIQKRAFYRCSNLGRVYLPRTLKTIGRYAFADSGLTGVYAFEKLDRVEDYAFAYCEELEEVLLSKGLNFEGVGICLGCHALKKIQIR